MNQQSGQDCGKPFDEGGGGLGIIINFHDLEPARTLITGSMADPGLNVIYDAVTILDVLEIDICARAVLDYVPVKDLVRSETTSRRWQRAILAYLRHSTLTLICVYSNGGWYNGPDVLPRRIVIAPEQYSLELVSKTLDKFGSSILEIYTSRCDEKYFDIIVSKCPNLQHIEFSDIYSFFGLNGNKVRLPLDQIKNCMQLKSLILSDKFSEHDLGDIYQRVHCEKIAIYGIPSVTGNFLKYIHSNNLKTLTINRCSSLNIFHLHTGVHSLRNITSLELNCYPTTVLENLHLLLKGMPKLEELTLCKYAYTNLSAELIKSFGRLSNLKRLKMICNKSVNDALLEALARGSPELEYLNLCASPYHTRGLAALCRRPVTTLCLGYIENCTYDLAARIRTNQVFEELEKLGCVELSPQCLEASRHASQGQRYPLHLRARCPINPFGRPGKELKIILFHDDITSFWFPTVKKLEPPSRFI